MLSVGYSPLVTMDSAHHMLTYACDTPGSDKPFWFVDREPFHSSSLSFSMVVPGLEEHRVVERNRRLSMVGRGMHRPCPCRKVSRSKWRKDRCIDCSADVGIVVGKNTPYKYIVVNIHYLSVLKNDYSGNQLIVSRRPYEHSRLVG